MGRERCERERNACTAAGNTFAAVAFAGREAEFDRPEDAEWPEWAGHIRVAWQALRDDRHYGAMGGLGGIWFASIDRYACRHSITGAAFDRFETFLRALDGEYMLVMAERAEAERERAKRR